MDQRNFDSELEDFSNLNLHHNKTRFETCWYWLLYTASELIFPFVSSHNYYMCCRQLIVVTSLFIVLRQVVCSYDLQKRSVLGHGLTKSSCTENSYASYHYCPRRTKCYFCTPQSLLIWFLWSLFPLRSWQLRYGIAAAETSFYASNSQFFV